MKSGNVDSSSEAEDSSWSTDEESDYGHDYEEQNGKGETIYKV